MPEHAMLIVHVPPSPMQEVFLDKHLYTIGRSNKCDIIITSPGVSRIHASITLIEESEYISQEEAHHLILDGDASIDGNKSTYGLFINGNKKDSHKLVNGDLIELGRNSRDSGIYLLYFQFYQAGRTSEEGGTFS